MTEKKPAKPSHTGIKIHQRIVRDALTPDREPYWATQLAAGRFIGFRQLKDKAGSWIARARIERPDAPGTWQQKYRDLGPISDTFDYDAAVKVAREWFDSLDAGVVNKGPFTVADACTEYVEELERAKRDKTAADATWRFERGGIHEGAFGRTEVEKLRAPALKKWRDTLVTEDDSGRQMTKAGANRMMTTLRAALNLAVQNNRVPPNAAQAWRSVKQFTKADGRRENFLDRPQRRALLVAAEGRAVHDLIEAALLIGARPGELVSLTRSAFDARTKTLKLTGKTGPRTMPLRGQAFTFFERIAKSKLPAALLLTRDDGGAWTRIEWSRQIRAVAETAIVLDAKGKPLKDDKGHEVKLKPGTCLYDCRHTYITQAIMDGLTTADVAKLTGTSLMMIDAHYSQFVQDAVAERLDKVQML